METILEYHLFSLPRMLWRSMATILKIIIIIQSTCCTVTPACGCPLTAPTWPTSATRAAPAPACTWPGCGTSARGACPRPARPRAWWPAWPGRGRRWWWRGRTPPGRASWWRGAAPSSPPPARWWGHIITNTHHTITLQTVVYAANLAHISEDSFTYL